MNIEEVKFHFAPQIEKLDAFEGKITLFYLMREYDKDNECSKMKVCRTSVELLKDLLEYDFVSYDSHSGLPSFREAAK